MSRHYLSFGARRKAISRRSPFGATRPHLTVALGVRLWIASLRVSRASPSALPESGPEKPTNATYGPTQLESFAKLNPDLCSWKTSQAFFDFLTSGESSPIWPRAASWDGTTAYRRLPLAPLTGATAFGSWPTPRANDAEKRGGFNVTDPRNGLPAAARAWPTPTRHDGKGKPGKGSRRRGGRERDLPTAAENFPTPKASRSGPDFARPGRPGTGGDDLVTLIARGAQYPTPCAADAEKGGRRDLYAKINNVGRQRKYFTPSASDHKGSNRTGQRRNQLTEQIELDNQGREIGQLNPAWVEWLMGWPIGWTALAPLAMDRFQEWQRQHSAPSAER